MGVPRTLTTHTVSGSPVAIDTETVIATVTGISTSMPDTNIAIDGWAAWLTGVGATSYRLRIRRGGLTGTVVADTGIVNSGVAASAVNEGGVNGDDSIPASGSQSYVLTATFSGGAAATTVNSVELQVSYTAS